MECIRECEEVKNSTLCNGLKKEQNNNPKVFPKSNKKRDNQENSLNEIKLVGYRSQYVNKP